MLTTDLALSWQRGTKVGPRLIDVEAASYLQEASDLINLFREYQGRKRAELEEALEEYVGVGTDYKILRGLIKLLMDDCKFETSSPAEPSEIRRTLFLKARLFHPVTALAGSRDRAVGEAAEELGCSPEKVMESIYADLAENQKLIQFDEDGPRALLDRYNLAQAQALLYRCMEMRLWVLRQDAANTRELFREIKAYRLIHDIKSQSSEYEIRLDGPVSLFHRSQKYGIQMAVFLPALLNCKGWRMRAEIASKKGGSAFYEINSRQEKLSSYRVKDVSYENPLVEKLVTSWASLDNEWTLAPSTEVIGLGETAFVPDFVVRHPEGKRIYMEVLGFWTPEYLDKRLSEFERTGFKDFIIAAWDELRGSREPSSTRHPNVVIFKRSLDPAAVRSVLERLKD
jgi:predicted nuclease of restriction endonuclease-like RecB superfamily